HCMPDRANSQTVGEPPREALTESGRWRVATALAVAIAGRTNLPRLTKVSDLGDNRPRPRAGKYGRWRVRSEEAAGERAMRRCWVVLLEVQTRAELELKTVEALLAELADRYPSALYAPDRCAVQFLVEDADGPDAALVDGVAVWRRALREVGFPQGDLVRAEVKTPAELVAEYDP